MPTVDGGRSTQAIREGDVRAFEALFRAHYPALCSFVRAQVGSADIAEEIVQDVFLRVWRGRATLDPALSLRAYLFRAARNASLNHTAHRNLERRWLAQMSAAPPGFGAHADEAVRSHELSAALRQTLAALPERCRLIFRMSRDDGLSYPEIADALGISVKTVETQMGRALKALRAGLAAFLA